MHPDAECCFGELSAYNYKRDANGDPTAIIEDSNNHYADAFTLCDRAVTSVKTLKLERRRL